MLNYLIYFQSFRPPFAIDSEKFNFTPRIQKLNQIDALIRARLIFDAQLASYWHMQGYTLEVPTVDNKYVDFYSPYKVCDACKFAHFFYSDYEECGMFCNVLRLPVFYIDNVE